MFRFYMNNEDKNEAVKYGQNATWPAAFSAAGKHVHVQG
jgi:hypothetical protein